MEYLSTLQDVPVNKAAVATISSAVVRLPQHVPPFSMAQTHIVIAHTPILQIV